MFLLAINEMFPTDFKNTYKIQINAHLSYICL